MGEKISDDPRLNEETPILYKPDRVVGYLGIAEVVGSFAFLVFQVSQTKYPASTLGARWVNGAIILVGYALFLWLFTGIARSRRAAFLGLFSLQGLLLLCILVTRLIGLPVTPFTIFTTLFFWGYCVARLFRMLGPALIRPRPY